VHLLDGGIEDTPEASLDRLCQLALEAQIYPECLHYYPFVLGAQPVRPLDLAAFYAAIANEGMRPTPHVIDSIERNGVVIYRHDPKSFVSICSVDRAAFYQLKTLMQGVVARGTARAANVPPRRCLAGLAGLSVGLAVRLRPAMARRLAERLRPTTAGRTRLGMGQPLVVRRLGAAVAG
jgi:hypothetical protein